MKLILLLFVCVIQFAALAQGTHHHMDMSAEPAAPITSESIYNVDVEWRDQAGASLKLRAFKGTPVVISMIYTHCTMACPMVVSEMKSIESKLFKQKRDQIHFVLVSFDPQRDTSERLAEFAKSHQLDSKHWRLLTGDKTKARLLATVLGIKYQRQKNGDYIHSSVISALDKDGVIRQQKIGLGASDRKFIKTLNAL